MEPITVPAIRACFVNCTKGEAQRMAVPKDLATRPWDDLDFLGWRDPAAEDRAYLVFPGATGLIGVALRVSQQTGLGRRSVCSVCLTSHDRDGVSLMTARLAGPAGRQGNSAGLYLCADLACSLYLRGKKDAGRRIEETLTLTEKIDRATTNLAAFLAKVGG
ncbi:FBP domain-containing protein [Catellatospora sp. KI3]|uniref:FBP domain-containing protein n=1 Tax=Catellatospora sp. KI3 TaxID=3041620 RepID=UPI002482490D|nr:FBP domain-containing protein [Catellatospora sp. KI3]MDI1465841.1 FBP domain-containing protein [Catellatospora sp. KI3]